MSEEEKKAIGWLSALDIKSEYEATNKEIILNFIEKQDKMINEIVDAIVGDKKILALMCKHIINKTEDECDKQNLLCDDCIREYFKKKVEEEENE